MTAAEFFMYCAGLGTVLISTGATVRLIRRPAPAREAARPRWEQVPDTADPAVEGLTRRLRDVQQTRYAPPIVHRELSADAGPPPRPTARAVRLRPATPAPMGADVPKTEG